MLSGVKNGRSYWEGPGRCRLITKLVSVVHKETLYTLWYIRCAEDTSFSMVHYLHYGPEGVQEKPRYTLFHKVCRINLDTLCSGVQETLHTLWSIRRN